MNSIHYIVISIIGLLFFFISYNNCKDTFFNEKDLNYENDGKMNFDYLLNSNHKTNILNKYYLDDDIKVNGRRLNTHPYQFKNYKNLLKKDGFKFDDDKHIIIKKEIYIE